MPATAPHRCPAWVPRLALVGAYVLAGELGPAPDLEPARIRSALARYEQVLRPFVARCQDLPNGIDRYAPMSESDIAITAAVMKWMQRWPFRPIAERMWFQAAGTMALPPYS